MDKAMSRGDTATVHETRESGPRNRNASKGAMIVLNGSPWAIVFSALALLAALIALINSNKVAEIAADAARAAAKAETATARANTAEIYAYQVYTELNRLGYPVKTPAESHEPQPPTPPEPQP